MKKCTQPRSPKLLTSKRSREREEYAARAAKNREELFRKQREELERRVKKKQAGFKY